MSKWSLLSLVLLKTEDRGEESGALVPLEDLLLNAFCRKTGEDQVHESLRASPTISSKASAAKYGRKQVPHEECSSQIRV